MFTKDILKLSSYPAKKFQRECGFITTFMQILFFSWWLLSCKQTYKEPSNFNVPQLWKSMHFWQIAQKKPDRKQQYAILTTCWFIKAWMNISNETCKTIFQTSKLELTNTEEPPSLLLVLIFCLSLFVSYTEVTWHNTLKCFSHCCTQVTVLKIVGFVWIHKLEPSTEIYQDLWSVPAPSKLPT